MKHCQKGSEQKRRERKEKKNLNKIMEWNDSDTYASCERIFVLLRRTDTKGQPKTIEQ